MRIILPSPSSTSAGECEATWHFSLLFSASPNLFFSLISPPPTPAVVLELSFWEWFVVLSPRLADSDSEVRLVNDMGSCRRVGTAQLLLPNFSATLSVNFHEPLSQAKEFSPPNSRKVYPSKLTLS